MYKLQSYVLVLVILSKPPPYHQWRNSRGAGGRVRPDIFHLEICADLPGKERQQKKENGEEKKENKRREGGKLKMERRKVTK